MTVSQRLPIHHGGEERGWNTSVQSTYQPEQTMSWEMQVKQEVYTTHGLGLTPVTCIHVHPYLITYIVILAAYLVRHSLLRYGIYDGFFEQVSVHR